MTGPERRLELPPTSLRRPSGSSIPQPRYLSAGISPAAVYLTNGENLKRYGIVLPCFVVSRVSGASPT